MTEEAALNQGWKKRQRALREGLNVSLGFTFALPHYETKPAQKMALE